MVRRSGATRYRKSRSAKGPLAGGMSIELVWGSVRPATMANAYGDWWEDFKTRLETMLGRVATGMEGYAKANHPWQNRTGRAEAGLSASARWEGETFVLELTHGVYYGVYLENRWGGKWGVIPISISTFQGPIAEAMQAALR